MHKYIMQNLIKDKCNRLKRFSNKSLPRGKMGKVKIKLFNVIEVASFTKNSDGEIGNVRK